MSIANTADTANRSMSPPTVTSGPSPIRSSGTTTIHSVSRANRSSASCVRPTHASRRGDVLSGGVALVRVRRTPQWSSVQTPGRVDLGSEPSSRVRGVRGVGRGHPLGTRRPVEADPSGRGRGRRGGVVADGSELDARCIGPAVHHPVAPAGEVGVAEAGPGPASRTHRARSRGRPRSPPHGELIEPPTNSLATTGGGSSRSAVGLPEAVDVTGEERRGDPWFEALGQGRARTGIRPSCRGPGRHRRGGGGWG